MANVTSTNDRLRRLQVYTEKLRQRLKGQLDANMREVVEIDLKKTEAQIARLK